MADFVMPKLGGDMTAGTLVAWHKKPGDAVKRGDVVAEVETDKGVIDVEVFFDGVIDKLVVKPGDHVPVGAVLATIHGEGAPAPMMPVATPPAAATVVPTAPETTEAGRMRVSPAARELARTLKVDVAKLQGTGPGGAITRVRTSSGPPAAKHQHPCQIARRACGSPSPPP
jgi:pyruvate dehydrogenase E2 component (dihydrolipoamide acetyltransferase)